MSPLRAFALSTLLIALFASSAHAQSLRETTPQALRAARAHYKRGAADLQAGRYPQAIEAFESAFRLYPNPLFHFNLAQAHRLNGDTAQAIDHYRRFLAFRAEGPDADEARAHVAELTAILERQSQSTDKKAIEAPANTAIPPLSPKAPERIAITPAPIAAPIEANPNKVSHQHKLWPWLVGGAVVVGGALAIGLGVGLSGSASVPTTPLGTIDFRQ